MKRSLIDKEDALYEQFLDSGLRYASGKEDGTKHKQLAVDAAVISKAKATRVTTAQLLYQVIRDKSKGLVPNNFDAEEGLLGHGS